jgi:transposase
VKRYRIKKGYYPNSNDLTTSSELKKQQAALEKQIRELEEENEILKKAMHIFTKNPL